MDVGIFTSKLLLRMPTIVSSRWERTSIMVSIIYYGRLFVRSFGDDKRERERERGD